MHSHGHGRQTENCSDALGKDVRSRVRVRKAGKVRRVADKVIDSSFPGRTGRRKGGDASAARSRYLALPDSGSGLDPEARKSQGLGVVH